MSILDEYMRQVELDKANENDDLAHFDNDEMLSDEMSDFDHNEYVKELKRLRNNPNDIVVNFRKEYPPLSNECLKEKNLIKTEEITAQVIHVYCPVCGKELIAKNKLYISPYTGEHIAKHECECGFKANLEDSYPKIVFNDNKNYEISYRVKE